MDVFPIPGRSALLLTNSSRPIDPNLIMDLASPCELKFQKKKSIEFNGIFLLYNFKTEKRIERERESKI